MCECVPACVLATCGVCVEGGGGERVCVRERERGGGVRERESVCVCVCVSE